MSAAANTTPIVTTVTKTANKGKTQKERDKVNIQDFCEEHYEDILPIIMDKVRRDKRKERGDHTDWLREKSSRKVIERHESLGIFLALEVAPPVETAPNTEIASATLKGRAMVSAPPNGLGPSIEDPLETDVDPGARGDGEKASLHHPADLKAAPVTRAIESQETLKEDAECQQREKHMLEWRSRSPLKGPREFVSMKYLWKASDSYKDLKALFCVLYAIEEDVKGPSGIKSIKRKVGETIGNSWAFKPWHKVTRQKVTLSFAQVNEITFPPLSANKGTKGPLVIEAEIRGHTVHRMYVDGGSSMEVLYEHCFNWIWPEIKSQMVPATTSLTGFSGETIWPLGQLWLLVTIGDAEQFIKAWMNFMIVRSPSPYNGIIGRPGIREIQAVPSTAHGILQFPVDGRVVTIRSTILTPNECATIMTTSKDSMKKIKGGQENLKVAIHYYFQAQEVALGGTLSIKGRTTLCGLLNRNLDIFAWKPSDIIGDCYPLSEIDWKVKSLYGYPFKCFLDAYKGYQQIQTAEKDEEKMAFHTPHRVYCYTKMPLGLKNAGATYQQLVDKAFEKAVEGMFLGYMIGPEGIKLWPEKIEVVLQLPSTWTVKEVQSLNGKLAGLNRSGASFQTIETTYIITPHVGGTKAKGRANNVLIRLLRSGWCCLDDRKGLNPDAKEASADMSEKEAPQEPWTLFMDGSSCIDGLGAGLILTSPDGAHFTYALRFQFTASNIEAEYEALLAGLHIAAQMGVPRSHNKKADALSKIASTNFAYLSKQVLVEVLQEKSIQECVGALQADYVIREIHEGSCSMHARPRFVVAKAMRSGYYWPTMHRDARDMILKCKDCQRINIAGPFPEGHGNVKFLIVAMDYFTKWTKAKAVATISGVQVKRFVWDNIVCCFGLPGEIVSDNGKQLSYNPFKDWCEKLNITQRFASVKHPQSNRLVERANRSLGEGIKARLGEGNKNWIEEIFHILWAHRTMIKSSNGDTSFSLTYGTEDVIPAEIGIPTYRTAVVDIVRNDDEIRLNLDLLEERRERAAIREAKAKSKMMRYYNARVCGVTFKPGDYVYSSNETSHAMDGGKLGPK
ncbi:reverse transcriptase domain-containing protein [Tanacetum coccineum]